MIEKTRFIPKYYQLQKAIRRMVEHKSLKAGELVPSENKLVGEYKVSKNTVRQALTNLVNEGFLYREQGKGTYVSDPAAERRGIGESKQIGLIVPDISHYFFPRIVRGIGDEAQRRNYHVILCNNDNDLSKTISHVHRFVRENNVRGLIVTPVQSDFYLRDNTTLVEELREAGLPFVLIDRYVQGWETDCVLSDNVHGGYQATSHLIELGHRRIGFIGEQECSTVLDRLKGYRQALSENGIEFADTLVNSGNNNTTERAGRAGMEYFLSMRDRPTAVFSENDLVAKGAFEAIREAGLSVPEDIALVGYDDLELAQTLDVPLTTVAQPGYKMGQEAARLLIAKSEGKVKKLRKIVLKSKLVIRSSSGAKNRQMVTAG